MQTKDGLKWLTKRERQYAISYYYKPQNTKSASQPANHYMRYSDIKSTNNKHNSTNLILNDQAALTSSTRSSINSNSNSQPQHQQQLNGRIVYKDLIENLNEWKFHYVISQINNLIDDENESLQEINDIYDLIHAYESKKATEAKLTQSKNSKVSNSAFSDIVFKITEALKVIITNFYLIKRTISVFE